MGEKKHEDIGIELLTPRQVMEAFLAGDRLVNTNYINGYGNDLGEAPEHYLYLSESGYICEEDGAGAKQDRVPIAMRNDERWWTLKK